MSQGIHRSTFALALVLAIGCGREPAQSSQCLDLATPVSLEMVRAYQRVAERDGRQDLTEDAARAEITRGLAQEAFVLETGLVDPAELRVRVAAYRWEAALQAYLAESGRRAVAGADMTALYGQQVEALGRRRAMLRHIVLPLMEGGDDDEAQARLLEAATLRGRLERGEDFGSLAEAYSGDPVTSGRGGMIGWVHEADLYPDVAQRVFDASGPGVLDPFRSAHAVHLIEIVDGPERFVPDVERALPDLERGVRSRARHEALRALEAAIELQRQP